MACLSTMRVCLSPMRFTRGEAGSALLALLAAAAASTATTALGVAGHLVLLRGDRHRAAVRSRASRGGRVLAALAGQHALLVRGACFVVREEAGVVLGRDGHVAVDVDVLPLVDDGARLGAATAVDGEHLLALALQGGQLVAGAGVVAIIAAR